MKLLDNVDELEGKTIKTCKVIDDDTQLAVIFDDGTYALFVLAFGYGDDDACIEIVNDVYLLSNYTKKGLGILSDEEYEVIKRKEKKLGDERQEKGERAELARLTEKYKND